MKLQAVIIVLLASTLTGACTSEQLYAAGRNAQRTECMKRLDERERDRCLKDADLSYDAYRREVEAR
jgi:cytochrome c556